MDQPPISSLVFVLDRPRTARLTLNSIRIFEKLTNRNLLFGETKWNEFTNGDVLCLLYAVMSYDNPDLTVDAIGNMLHPSMAPGLITQLMELWEKSMPTARPGAAPIAPVGEDGSVPKAGETMTG